MTSIKKRYIEEGAYIQVSEDLTQETLNLLEEEVQEFIKEKTDQSRAPNKMILDFSQVRIIDSAALLYLMEMHQSLEQKGHRLELHHIPQDIFHIMDIVGIVSQWKKSSYITLTVKDEKTEQAYE